MNNENKTTIITENELFSFIKTIKQFKELNFYHVQAITYSIGVSRAKKSAVANAFSDMN